MNRGARGGGGGDCVSAAGFVVFVCVRWYVDIEGPALLLLMSVGTVRLEEY